jgi:hypothetical protein
MSLDAARGIADAVLYEGYLLYPYRASAAKNQVRWQFGVLGAPGAADAGIGEEPEMSADLLVECADLGAARLDVHLRFLQVQARSVEQVQPDGTFSPVDELQVGTARFTSWHEAVECELAFPAMWPADPVAASPIALGVAGGSETEDISDAAGAVVGRLVRTRWPLTGLLDLTLRHEGSAPGVYVLRVCVGNSTDWRAPDGTADGRERDVAARRSFVGTHLLLQLHGGRFLSSADPPAYATGAAATCTSRRCWPVMLGDEAAGDLAMVSPIVLDDYPAIAPESPGALFDSTEIDEILSLRVLTLTDEEKADARATDPRAAALVDRIEAMGPEAFERLHGAMRAVGVPSAGDDAAGAADEAAGWWTPEADAAVEPETHSVTVAGVRVTKGSRVRLRPMRRADAQDMFLTGQFAVVTRVNVDVDGETHVAVVLEDDPARELAEWYGRFYYFAPDEIEPVAIAPSHASMPPQQGVPS